MSLAGFRYSGVIEFICDPPHSRKDLRVIVTTILGNFIQRGVGDMAYTLPDDKGVQVQVAYVDARGNPAKVDGDVVWSSSDPTIIAVSPMVATPVDGSPAPAGAAMVTPVGPLGQAQVQAVADADLGTGTQSLTTLFDVQVVAGTAVSGVITPVGDPVPLPPPT